MDLKLTKQLLFCFVLTSLCGAVLSGFCTVEYNCEEKCVNTFDFLKLFDIDYEYTTTCDATCRKKDCCTGYTGEQCDELTEECKQQGKCAGHICVEQYTEGCMCRKEEKTSQTFMGENTRIVQVQCEHPCERKICCSGYIGDDCNEEVPNGLLSATELEHVRNQLKIDEGYEKVIYKDSVGKYTFGIGHLIRETDEEFGEILGTEVSDQRIQEVFVADVKIAINDVTGVFRSAYSFPGEVKEILVNMMFNLGRTKLKTFKKFVNAVNARDWTTAAEKMVDSLWNTQFWNRTVQLVNRMKAVGTDPGEETNNGNENDGASLDLSASELTELYNSNIIQAEYMTRPLDSWPFGSSYSGGRKKREWEYYPEHAGVRVTLTDNNQWLIHKGSDFGDVSTTVITSASYMTDRWNMEECKLVEGFTVNDFMGAAQIEEDYSLFNIKGANCQRAAHRIFDLLEQFQECP